MIEIDKPKIATKADEKCEGGTAHPTKKLACFMFHLKIINIFWKMKYASYSKLSKELKNSNKILKVGQAVIELLIQINIFIVLIQNLKTAWPTKISMPFLSSLNNLL